MNPVLHYLCEEWSCILLNISAQLDVKLEIVRV